MIMNKKYTNVKNYKFVSPLLTRNFAKFLLFSAMYKIHLEMIIIL